MKSTTLDLEQSDKWKRYRILSQNQRNKFMDHLT